MLYKRNGSGRLSDDLFRKPSREYRGAPFWSWNTKMSKEHVDHILSDLKEMGMGGAHIHARTGLATPYLGDEFMELVRYGIMKARELDMLVWLYDEDRWPSGAGGGLVTKDHSFRSRFLVLSPVSLEGVRANAVYATSAKAVRSQERTFLGRYCICLEDGYLKDFIWEPSGAGPDGDSANGCAGGPEDDLLLRSCPDGYQEWFAYLEVSGDHPWYNNQAYLNTLDTRAVGRFVEVTHERYFQAVGDEFGKTIPAIFTDEPQFTHKGRLGFSGERSEVMLPFTDDLEETYAHAYGDSLLVRLPEVVWDLPDSAISVTRYRYHDHICERFTRAFADQIGAWCEAHQIALTGHMMYEATLASQTSALGEAMRSYRAFSLPGIDLLCDARELSTAKQAASVARQYGREGVISELYGVTDWDFDFRGHKLQGDWQAALGITVRVPHLTWTSMAGESKRDYPAPIGYQSPWYREYAYVEDYFARLATALTRGKAVARVGVIHPIETFWLYWGTQEKSGELCSEMDANFDHLIRWLLFGLIDFDFIAESLFAGLTDPEAIGAKRLPVGAAGYDVILVPDCLTLRHSTFERLKRFHESGGMVLFTGKTPRYLDALPSTQVERFVEDCRGVAFTRSDLLKALEPWRLVDVRSSNGNRSDNLIYQWREDGNSAWLFLSHVERMKNPDIPVREDYVITIMQKWDIKRYDALTGNIEELPAVHRQGRTVLHLSLYEHDSLLLCLSPRREKDAREEGAEKTAIVMPAQGAACASSQEKANAELLKTQVSPSREEWDLTAAYNYTLSEPNVLLLDMAEWKLSERDTGKTVFDWQPKEEILRLDNRVRRFLGCPLRMEAAAQPWVSPGSPEATHTLLLRFTIETKHAISGARLALEDAEEVRIFLDHNLVKGRENGWYTDRAIRTVPLPELSEGNHTLTVNIPWHNKRNVEAIYLLGDFAVSVAGSHALLCQKPDTLPFGDLTGQGFPFYGGNVTYRIPMWLPKGKACLQINRFRAPLITAALDQGMNQRIAFSPYSAEFTLEESGIRMMSITVFGNRRNTFGSVHNCDDAETWFGPGAWRTDGERWSYEYCLKPFGILKAPHIMTETATDESDGDENERQ